MPCSEIWQLPQPALFYSTIPMFRSPSYLQDLMVWSETSLSWSDRDDVALLYAQIDLESETLAIANGVHLIMRNLAAA